MKCKSSRCSHELTAAELACSKADGYCARCYSAGVPELVAEIAEKDASFDLRWKADMKAIKSWQEATGKALEWPDHKDLCVWLMDELAAARAVVEPLERLLASQSVDIYKSPDSGKYSVNWSEGRGPTLAEALAAAVAEKGAEG